ncbi:uncharacterized protein YALI1_E28439g [Yarrowia lipolytica]|uniref:Uncharacterized protein n=1 Tax=Yarrowia lipolytica TaxID=4952 RepID=A0A1D8NJT3_YARLL|nr:hypothetical protein YALI1_E28439g [Yarrowia lipolytica]
MDLVDGVHWGYLHEKGCHYTELCSTTSRMEGEGKRIYRGGLIDNVAYALKNKRARLCFLTPPCPSRNAKSYHIHSCITFEIFLMSSFFPRSS